MEANYKEPIFYHNGDFSSFLDATKISAEGITLSPFNNIPDLKAFELEFSFPSSDVIVKAKAKLDQSNKKKVFLKFSKISAKDKKLIASFVNSKSKVRNISTRT